MNQRQIALLGSLAVLVLLAGCSVPFGETTPTEDPTPTPIQNNSSFVTPTEMNPTDTLATPVTPGTPSPSTPTATEEPTPSPTPTPTPTPHATANWTQENQESTLRVELDSFHEVSYVWVEVPNHDVSYNNTLNASEGEGYSEGPEITSSSNHPYLLIKQRPALGVVTIDISSVSTDSTVNLYIVEQDGTVRISDSYTVS